MEPTSTTTQASQPVEQSQSYRRSSVVYVTGINRLNPSNRHAAVLEWASDNHIRLTVVDGSMGAQTTVLDCLPQDVKRFSTAVGVANLILQTGQRFTIEFSMAAGNAVIAGTVASQFGVGGLVASTAIDQHAVELEAATDIEWWSSTLAKFGVHGFQASAKSMYKIDKAGWWMLGIILGVALLFGLVALIIFLISAAGIA